ncbi:MAG: hypothetical protein HZB84_09695 [Deltaproteobacteria bacterium]|nr:hypothetical protein [Deltaproteobacteria bacterium]MBI5903739.1 hypothetical protein [Deltaproteobacteria bacterium]
MAITVDSFLKRGYVPLACNQYAGVAWRGEYLKDFWMWNRQYAEYSGGVKYIQTIKVTDLKEAAFRYWRDGWVPLKPVDEGLLRMMEKALRGHRGLKKNGVKLPDNDFLKMPEEIPEKYLGPEVRRHLGLNDGHAVTLQREDELSGESLEAYKKTRGGY